MLLWECPSMNTSIPVVLAMMSVDCQGAYSSPTPQCPSATTTSAPAAIAASTEACTVEYSSAPVASSQKL